MPAVRAVAVLCLLLVAGAASAQRPASPRVVVTTDPELDDSNSLLRFLLYSTDFRIEGLVYASSQFHWKGDGTGRKWFVAGREYTRFGLNLCPCESWRWAPGERFIDAAVDVYERVYRNAVTMRWWRWKDVDTYPGEVTLSSPRAPGATQFQVPVDAMPGQTIQLVLEATDGGAPPLTRYRRVVVSVRR